MIRKETLMKVPLLTDDSGQTLAEYGLILFLVAVAVIAALTYFGDALLGKYNEITNEIENKTS
jgi:pilus assembly protein Flp/PilA